jgi:hypothetical protein
LGSVPIKEVPVWIQFFTNLKWNWQLAVTCQLTLVPIAFILLQIYLGSSFGFTPSNRSGKLILTLGVFFPEINSGSNSKNQFVIQFLLTGTRTEVLHAKTSNSTTIVTKLKNCPTLVWYGKIISLPSCLLEAKGLKTHLSSR